MFFKNIDFSHLFLLSWILFLLIRFLSIIDIMGHFILHQIFLYIKVYFLHGLIYIRGFLVMHFFTIGFLKWYGHVKCIKITLTLKIYCRKKCQKKWRKITSLLQKFKLGIGCSIEYYPSYSKMKSWNMIQMHLSKIHYFRWALSPSQRDLCDLLHKSLDSQE